MIIPVAAAEKDQPGTEIRLPAEIDWAKLDKPRFFVLGLALYSGISAVFYPMTTLKTRLQVSNSSLSPTKAANAIVRHEGLRGLYGGFFTALSGTIPARALYVTAYEALKSYAVAATDSLGLPDVVAGPAACAGAGFCAGAVSQFVWTPIDVVSQQLMVQGTAVASPQSKYRGGVDAFTKILRHEGLRGLYRGFGVSILVNAPTSGTWWASYAVSQNIIWGRIEWWSSRRDTAGGVFEPSHMTVATVQGVSGAMAGAAAGVMTMPLDTIKTRLQVMDGSGKRAAGFTAVVRTVKGMRREGWWMASFRGLGPQWAYTSLSAAILSMTYEFLKRRSVKESGELRLW